MFQDAFQVFDGNWYVVNGLEPISLSDVKGKVKVPPLYLHNTNFGKVKFKPVRLYSTESAQII